VYGGMHAVRATSGRGVRYTRRVVTAVSGTGPRTADARATAPRLDSLTGLRFFAAWLVLQHHFTNFGTIPGLARFTGFGTTGVSFFFVLSGFVLTWSFVRSDTPPRFYWRRFARIVPLHLITTALALPVFYNWGGASYDWTAIALSFLLLHAWVPTATTYFAGNPASWTLSCEMFFYALHPFVVRPMLRWGLALLAGGAILIGVALYVVSDMALDWPARITGWLLYISPLFRVGEFLLGMLLAAALRRGYRLPAYLVPSTILLAAWFYLYYQFSPQHLSGQGQIVVADLSYVALPLLYGLIIAAAAQRDLAGKRSLLAAKPLVVLGQWSYALYLVHATIIYALIYWLGARPYGWTNVLWLGAVSAICIAASGVLYHTIEHPLERRLRHMQRRPAEEAGSLAAEPAAG
jgi:peptidoglycan/LPS O-acetylase OafA/YrhL